jgi:protein gp37
MNKTTIEWTDRTWNPVTGCTKVSQGCKNCYAERIYERFNGHGTFKLVHLHPDRLNAPKLWKKPSMIFVNSMSDLFHEDVPFDFIIRVYLAMLYNKHHTYQILTKRPERALKIFKVLRDTDNVMYDAIKSSKNIWHGVSVEDQATADLRIPLLLQFPVPVRFLSCEPLLGAVNLRRLIGRTTFANAEIQWVICGGESGPKARPMHPDWVRGIRDYCKGASIPFFFKQWGGWRPYEVDSPPDWYDACSGATYDGHGMNFTDENGDPGKWYGGRWMYGTEAQIICMEHRNEMCMFLRLSKKKAGHLLDGNAYHQFPNLNQ